MTWGEWKSRWDTETHMKILLGLLHCGFDMTVETWEQLLERVSLYFDVADGHLEGQFGEARGIHSERLLAKKAFSMLATKVFTTNESNEHKRPDWTFHLCQPGMLRKLVWFFRPDEPIEEGCCKLTNLWRNRFGGRDHAIDTTVAFLGSLLEFSFRETWTTDPQELIDMRPQLIRIAACFGIEGLRFLANYDRRGVFAEASPLRSLDESCIEALREVAFGKQQWLPIVREGTRFTHGPRKPRSIEEAIWGGSFAAILLQSALTMQAETQRFAALEAGAKELQKASFMIDLSSITV